MYLRPMRQDSSDQTRAIVASLPAPTGGWNARDNITGMSPLDAITLENWFPDDDNVRLRRGFEAYLQGIGGAVETLVTYSALGTDKMFAIANGAIYDASISILPPQSTSLLEDDSGSELLESGLAYTLLEESGDPLIPIVSGYSSSRWQWVNFETPGGNFIVMVNGVDVPKKYNGSVWSDTIITGTGLTASNLININVFKDRIFFVEENTLNVWYLPVNSIAGAADKFTLGAVAKKGGHLMAMGTWTFDGGQGLDDYAVFITNKGEAIVYQGTDPSDITAWALVGVYEIGAPIGRRCVLKVGGELVIITIDGFQLLSIALGNARVKTNGNYSDKIKKAVRDAARVNGSNFGWQAILYPRGGMGIFNVPRGNQTDQYVVNTNTGSWCKFTGMNANCWAVYKEDLYFGADAVYKADSGADDDNSLIIGNMEMAFSYYGKRGKIKHFTMMRPVLSTNGANPGVSVGVNVDYSRDAEVTDPGFSGTLGSAWGSPWGSAWGLGADMIVKDWLGVAAVGYAASPHLKVSSNAVSVALNSIDMMYETGGAL